MIPPDGSVLDIVDDGSFELRLRAAESVYLANEPIDIEAELSYVGEQAAVRITGAGILGFGVRQLDGPLGMSWLAPLPCGPVGTLSREPMVIPFYKSGGISGSDPNREFWESYFADPELRPPEGTWQIYATTFFTLGAECRDSGPDLTATVTIKVEP